ncbi:gluconokinase [Mucilaginibacter achroorhodeus]|uniref:Gluconokinase n=1 Tax=Mucilaginibacter achroorhodeus TaxID=2599294 RepID=A0A563U2U6_9SPHI|nr:gluconokinase [Mucilaginibacter achroorhodeus]TWR25655.1 gluconokinase [Mucilaginibacter achroorhodeus]
MQKYYLGVDLGTGSAKAVAIDADGNTLATAQDHYNFLQPQPGYAEQDPELIWQAFLSCLQQIDDQLKETPVAISFSSAMHSVMAVDITGRPLVNAMLWSDARSGAIAEELRAGEHAQELYKHTGTAIYAMSPLCKIMWLKQNKPEIFAKTHKFISIKEYIWFKLFGVYEVDHSIASSTGMFDISDLKWYEPALQMAGINTGKLSTPVETTYSRKLTNNTSIKGLSFETLIFTGASDGCCANLGGNAIKAGVGALTIGTSGAVRVGSDRPIYNFKAMTFNYLLKANTFICGGAVNNGGGAVNWLLQNFLKKDLNEENYKGFFNQVESISPGSDGLLFLPYLYAERAPVWDAKSSASFINISAKHQQAHFLRAGLEGICFALNDVLNAVEQGGGVVNELVISGGFIASPVWVQMLADITGKRLVILQSDDSSAIGAIYLAMETMGIDIEAIRQKEAGTRTEISPNLEIHARYKKIFAVYQELYGTIKESVHRLHSIATL